MARPLPAKHPKLQPALVIDASASLTATIYGRGGTVAFIRGREVFVVSDLEMAHVEHARRVFRNEERAPDEGGGGKARLFTSRAAAAEFLTEPEESGGPDA